MTIRVMLVDDHKILREALKGILDREHDITLVGEANDGSEALTLASQCHPDIVLMDVGMPMMGGIEATRLLVEKHPAIPSSAVQS